jgi:hypothetical protein
MESILPFIADSKNTPLIEAIEEFKLNAIPASIRGEDEERFFTVKVVRRSGNSRYTSRWAVMFENDAYNEQLEDKYESMPSNRTDEFLENFRFPLEKAILIGEKLAQRVLFRGISAQDVINHGGLIEADIAIPRDERLRTRVLPESALPQEEDVFYIGKQNDDSFEIVTGPESIGYTSFQSVWDDIRELNTPEWDALAGSEGFSDEVLRSADYLPYRLTTAASDVDGAYGYLIDADPEMNRGAVLTQHKNLGLDTKVFPSIKLARGVVENISNLGFKGNFVIKALIPADYDAQRKFNESILGE